MTAAGKKTKSTEGNGFCVETISSSGRKMLFGSMSKLEASLQSSRSGVFIV